MRDRASIAAVFKESNSLPHPSPYPSRRKVSQGGERARISNNGRTREEKLRSGPRVQIFHCFLTLELILLERPVVLSIIGGLLRPKGGCSVEEYHRPLILQYSMYTEDRMDFRLM